MLSWISCEELGAQPLKIFNVIHAAPVDHTLTTFDIHICSSKQHALLCCCTSHKCLVQLALFSSKKKKNIILLCFAWACTFSMIFSLIDNLLTQFCIWYFLNDFKSENVEGFVELEFSAMYVWSTLENAYVLLYISVFTTLSEQQSISSGDNGEKMSGFSLGREMR